MLVPTVPPNVAIGFWATEVPVKLVQEVAEPEVCTLDANEGVKAETVAVPKTLFVWHTLTSMLSVPFQVKVPALNTCVFKPAPSGVKLAWLNTVVTGVV